MKPHVYSPGTIGIKEAADKMHVTYTVILAWIKKGLLPAQMVTSSGTKRVWEIKIVDLGKLKLAAEQPITVKQ